VESVNAQVPLSPSPSPRVQTAEKLASVSRKSFGANKKWKTKMADVRILNQLPIEVLIECSAINANGRECARFTDKGDLCTQHAQLLLGVRVKLSLIPGADEGLFAAGRDFHQGDVICAYLGAQMTTAAFRANPSAYAVQLYRGVLDARRTCDGFGRYANAANAMRQANAQLISERKLIGRRGSSSRIFLQATKTIRDGHEVLLKYGPGYWRAHAPIGTAHPV
jgi:hypothetical protein